MLAFGFGLAGDIKFRQDEIKELVGVDPGVEEKGGTGFAVMQPVEQPVNQRGFPCSDLAGQGDKTFPRLDSVHQARQGLLDLLRQE